MSTTAAQTTACGDGPGIADRFLSLVLANRSNAMLLDRFPDLRLTDWWLTAGCLAQSVWNVLSGRPAETDILDYDIIYFDPDTSWDAEDAIIRRTARLFAGLPVSVQVRNQARVPLWYAGKFGIPFPPVQRASDGIDRFPCGTVAVGVRRDEAGFRIYAPFGLHPMMQGRLFPNPVLNVPDVYAAKTSRWRQLWPALVVEPWPQPPESEDRFNRRQGRSWRDWPPS